MYPSFIQLETRRRLLREELALARERHADAASARKRRWALRRRRALATA